MVTNMHKDGFSYDGHRVITCDALTETGLVRHGFSTKKEGTSPGKYASLNLGIHTSDDPQLVRQNFTLFCRDAAVDLQHLILAKQVHSTVVLPVTAKDAGKGLFLPRDFSEADGFVTNEPGICLATFYADCTPILLLDPVCRVIGSVHSGWRGTLGQIVCRAVSLMQSRYGSKSEDILVATGPSIKQCHFEVGKDVYELFTKQFGAVAEQNTVQKGEKYYIDTDAINVHSLISMGVLRRHIHLHTACTYCGKETFFSYRRDGETGRMCAMIELI